MQDYIPVRITTQNYTELGRIGGKVEGKLAAIGSKLVKHMGKFVASSEGGVEPELLTAGVLCDLCNHPVLESHCKLICQNCGYTRDCSDP